MKYIASNSFDPNDNFEIDSTTPEAAAFSLLSSLGWKLNYAPSDDTEKKMMKAIDTSVVRILGISEDPMDGDEIQHAIDYFSDALKEIMGDKEN